MNLTILDFAHHRNGVCGAPFAVILFKDAGRACSRKVAILFEQDGHCAVLDVDKLAQSDIAFGSNSWIIGSVCFQTIFTVLGKIPRQREYFLALRNSYRYV